jgi:UDP-MurNAc hydroxylase
MKSARQREIDSIKSSLPRGEVDVLHELKKWFEPLLEKADVTCAGINGIVVLDLGDDAIAIDFHRRVVERWPGGDDWDYRFYFDRALIEHCIVDHVEDWVNDIFLSCRFEAERKGAFNEYVYNFFKCLSMERLQYAEGYYAERAPIDQFWEAEGYRIQRRCPHLKADLTKFAEIENGVLTCTLHGWQFELDTGKCLTSDDRRLYSRPLSEGAGDPAEIPQQAGGASIRDDCGHCTYRPERFRRRASSTDPSSRAAG